MIMLHCWYNLTKFWFLHHLANTQGCGWVLDRSTHPPCLVKHLTGERLLKRCFHGTQIIIIKNNNVHFFSCFIQKQRKGITQNEKQIWFIFYGRLYPNLILSPLPSSPSSWWFIAQDSVDERVTSSHFKTSTVAGKKVTFAITSCRWRWEYK